jgi:hypothetical protein
MSNKVKIEFIHMPDDKMREVGPFDFVQFTYGSVRVGDHDFIADFVGGFWVTEDGEQWTDISVVPA